MKFISLAMRSVLIVNLLFSTSLAVGKRGMGEDRLRADNQ